MTHSTNNTGRQTIAFWFDLGSNYSYLTAMRIEALASTCEVDVVWKPFLLGPIFQSFGWDSSPFVLQKQKGEYTWKDMERQAHKHGIAWKKPSTFPRRAILPTRVAILGSKEKWIGDFVRATMARNFVEDKDLDTEDAVREVLAAINVNADLIIAQAQSDENKQLLCHATETAAKLGIFGAPMFFVGDEMFWGNDRLEDALAYANSQSQ
jgi:2-hydroxychromene-2-carboxylate isomerase